MPDADAKVMFEIYRENTNSQKFRAVYFTELDEHNRETEIARAMAGKHVYDSFLAERHLDEGKHLVATILDRLNDGEPLDTTQLGEMLAPYET